MIERSLTPAFAADVANPALRLCPPNSSGSIPIRSTAFLTIFQTHFIPYLEELLNTVEIDNPKGVLQELVQKASNTSPRYRTVSEEGPAHAKTFSVEVLIEGEVKGHGAGPNKQAAEIMAAQQAIENMETESKPG